MNFNLPIAFSFGCLYPTPTLDPCNHTAARGSFLNLTNVPSCSKQCHICDLEQCFSICKGSPLDSLNAGSDSVGLGITWEAAGLTCCQVMLWQFLFSQNDHSNISCPTCFQNLALPHKEVETVALNLGRTLCCFNKWNVARVNGVTSEAKSSFWLIFGTLSFGAHHAVWKPNLVLLERKRGPQPRASINCQTCERMCLRMILAEAH